MEILLKIKFSQEKIEMVVTLVAFTCSKSTIETPEQCVKLAQS